MNFRKYSEYKVHIFFAIAAAIFVTYCFEPLINFSSRIFIYLSESISSKYLDSLYRDIALGKTDYALGLYSLLMLLFNILAVRIMLKVFFHTGTTRSKTLIDNTEKVKKIETLRGENRFFKFFASLFIFILSLLMFLVIVSSNIKISTIMTFEQRIKILTPYIDDKEKDILISNFASMKTYQDYKNIVSQIEKLAKDKNISLPTQSYFSTY